MCHVDVTGVHLISIPAPPRGATAISRGQIASKSFQFPPLCEGRRHGSDPAPPSCHFNFRPSARGDLARLCSISITMLFQFTPLREGRRRGRLRRIRLQAISIHAPPRGATWPGERKAPCRSFQFTPPREGRRTSALQAPIATYFNSRPSARGDLRMFSWFTPSPISIHAPPRGATAKDMQFLQIFCSTLTNYRALAAEPCNMQGLFW